MNFLHQCLGNVNPEFPELIKASEFERHEVFGKGYVGVSVFIQSVAVNELEVLEPTCNVVELTIRGGELAGDVKVDVGQRVGVNRSHETVKIMTRKAGEYFKKHSFVRKAVDSAQLLIINVNSIFLTNH